MTDLVIRPLAPGEEAPFESLPDPGLVGFAAGDRRAMSSSRISWPSARSWATAASMYRVVQSTTEFKTRPSDPNWSYPN
ncbi:hypothetical protein OG953_42570 [Streptomyces sp. NBC_00057]